LDRGEASYLAEPSVRETVVHLFIEKLNEDKEFDEAVSRVVSDPRRVHYRHKMISKVIRNALKLGGFGAHCY